MTICASSGYAAVTLLDEPRVKSVAMVAPWLHDGAIVRDVYGGDAGVQTRLQQAAEAREKYARTGVVDYIAAASNSDPTAAMHWPGDRSTTT